MFRQSDSLDRFEQVERSKIPNANLHEISPHCVSSRVVAAKYNGVANSQENYCIIREEKIYTSYVSVYKQYQGVTQIKFNYTKFRVY